MTLPIVEQRDRVIAEMLGKSADILRRNLDLQYNDSDVTFDDNEALRRCPDRSHMWVGGTDADQVRRGRRWIAYLAPALASAEMILWRPDLWTAAVAGKEQFAGTRLTEALLPIPLGGVQWWSVDESAGRCPAWQELITLAARSARIYASWGANRLSVALPMSEPLPGDAPITTDSYRLRGVIVCAAHQENGDKGLHFHLVLHSQDARDRVTRLLTVRLALGARLRDHPLILALAAATDFLTQPFLLPAKQATESAQRGSASLPPELRKKYRAEVQRVILRRARPEKEGDEAPARKIGTDKCWEVMGHRRRLKQPRKADGRQVIFVTPYIKGDPDKPLLSRRDRIAEVKR